MTRDEYRHAIGRLVPEGESWGARVQAFADLTAMHSRTVYAILGGTRPVTRQTARIVELLLAYHQPEE